MPDANFREHLTDEVRIILLLGGWCIDLYWLRRRHARSVRGSREGRPLHYHQDRSNKAERWPQRQGESNPESDFEWKKSDREHRSGAHATPQKPSRHNLQPTDDQERDEQRNSGSYADSLKWPPAVRRKTEECPDLTGRREVPDPVGTRQTKTKSQKDAEDRGELHHGLGCGGRSTR
jgi:hypothetical protein